MDLAIVRAAIGDENLQKAFWLAIGSLVFSNAGLIIGAVVSHFRKIAKMRSDLNEAFRRIRDLENNNTQGDKK